MNNFESDENGLSAVCFGEVLWDVFPKHKKIGGAPLNVAFRMNSLGLKTTIISSIGNDNNGQDILSFLKNQNIKTDFIQISEGFQTGVVNVIINEKGNASYDIVYPSAWDKIVQTESMDEIVSEADIFVFGSLICRDEVSRSTLFHLLKKAKYKVLDINLRVPFHTINILLDLMQKADFIKLNEDELLLICNELQSPFDFLEGHVEFIAEETYTKQICVTKGASGAVLFYNNKFYYQKGYPVEVIDTVGAGDSFLASLIVRLSKQGSPQEALNYACAVGALVAGKEGANPELTDKDIEDFMMLI